MRKNIFGSAIVFGGMGTSILTPSTPVKDRQGVLPEPTRMGFNYTPQGGNLLSTLQQMARQALSVATQALRATQNLGIPFTIPLVDNTPLGSFWVRVNYSIGTTATNVPIKLTRKPSGCLTYNSSAGTLVYQSPADVTATTPLIFVCRSNSATTATILVG